MSLNIEFPEFNRSWHTPTVKYHRYYHIHFSYILNIFKYAKCNVKMVNSSNFKIRNKTAFEVNINNNLILFDFSDFEQLSEVEIDKYKCVFKFHYNKLEHINYNNVFPFSPVNFQDWNCFYNNENKIKYNANGIILNKQKAYGNAIERREYVRHMLVSNYGQKVDSSIVKELAYYMSINRSLISVFVPGARNDMLDRGQGQYMFFGSATISPKLNTILSYNKEIIPNCHYICCKDDYSDLIDKIQWVNGNKEQSIQIGFNAKKLMLETSTPAKQIEYIKSLL